jgi:hypothetical protein
MTGKIYFIVPVNTASVVPEVIDNLANRLTEHAAHCNMAYYDVAKEPARTDATVRNFTKDVEIAIGHANRMLKSGKSSVIFIRGNNATGFHRNQWQKIVNQQAVNTYEITYMLIEASERAQKIAFAHRGRGDHARTFKMWDRSIEFITVQPNELTRNTVYQFVPLKLFNDGKEAKGTPHRITDESMKKVNKCIPCESREENKSGGEQRKAAPGVKPWADDTPPATPRQTPICWDDATDTDRRFVSSGGGDVATARRFASFGGGDALTARRFASSGGGDVPTARRFSSSGRGDVPTARRSSSSGGGDALTARRFASSGVGGVPTARRFASSGVGGVPTERRSVSSRGDDVPTARRFASRWGDDVPTARRFASSWGDDVQTARRFASRWGDDVPTARRFASRCEDDLYERVPTEKNLHTRGVFHPDNHAQISQAITNSVMQRINF